MSAEIVRLKVIPKLVESGKNKGQPPNTKDYDVDVRRERNTFNESIGVGQTAREKRSYQG